MPRHRTKGIPKATDSSQSAPKEPVGLLVTAELEEALTACKKKVERIAKICRATNRKFRDSEFDLENDPISCLYGVEVDEEKVDQAPDVRRVSQIFENPKFFADRPSSSDINQGALGDCWFLSALATMSTSPGLIEKLCVARDEEIGVYGFIFFRDSQWETVIIDDQLFWSIPKFEELNGDEKKLYHNDKDIYNSIARKGGKGLHFARSGTAGETWVPLIEKAYAKLHGDFASLDGGHMSEAIEDLTGGVSVVFNTADILDPSRFWDEVFLRANDNTHLFGVSFGVLDKTRSGDASATVQGLMGGHAYSILRVKECRGKRFIVLRNPWGDSEWTGRWSDGSKEWTGEWLQVLKELDHEMGDDGEFVMEYSDFLETWETIEQTTIFDSSWVMSSHWLSFPPKPLAHAWSYGEAVFYFSLPKASTAVIVLSQLDDRYFQDLDGLVAHNVEFAVYNRSTRELKGESVSARFWSRSVSCQLQLEAGDYAVYPRIDRNQYKPSGQFEETVKSWSKRKLSRVLTQRTKSRSIAANYDIGPRDKFLPITLSDIIQYDLLEKEDGEDEKPSKEGEETVDKGEPEKPASDAGGEGQPSGPGDVPFPYNVLGGPDGPYKKPSITTEDEDENPVFLGLKVYTKQEAVVSISGRIRGAPENEDDWEDEEGSGDEDEDEDEDE